MATAGEQPKLTCGQKFSNGLASFGKFLYNSETKEVMGRSGKSWAKIGLFYFVFYGFLAAFFSAMLAVFLATVNDPKLGKGPKLTQFLTNQPPGLKRLGNETSLRGFNSTDENAAMRFRNNTKDLFAGFKEGVVYSGVCDPQSVRSPNEKPCFMNNTHYGPCSPDDADDTMFGYTEKKPCIFVKINRVFGWIPEVDGQFLKLDCETKIKDALIGTYPDGFLLAGFPFRGVQDHNLPYVAIKVDASKLNVQSTVDCKLSGKNIEASESFHPARSYGNIQIKEVYSSN